MTDEKKAKLRLDVICLLNSKGIGRNWVNKLEVFNLPSGERVMIIPEGYSFDNWLVKVTREERYLTGHIAPSTQLATFNKEDLFDLP
jgi:hypothetical protein